jgi:hypothetical protein
MLGAKSSSGTELVDYGEVILLLRGILQHGWGMLASLLREEGE